MLCRQSKQLPHSIITDIRCCLQASWPHLASCRQGSQVFAIGYAVLFQASTTFALIHCNCVVAVWLSLLP
jgi:hypothetical protein